jgi:hypothetical protein
VYVCRLHVVVSDCLFCDGLTIVVYAASAMDRNTAVCRQLARWNGVGDGANPRDAVRRVL